MKFNLTLLLGFLVALVVIYGILYFSKDGVVAQKALAKGVRNYLFLAPILACGFLIGTGIVALIPREVIPKIMGEASGFTGMLIGSGAGILTPGSPVIDYPIIKSLRLSGAGVGALIAMAVAGKVWSLSMFPVEASILGVKFTVVHYISTFSAPFISGAIGALIWNFMGFGDGL